MCRHSYRVPTKQQKVRKSSKIDESRTDGKSRLAFPRSQYLIPVTIRRLRHVKLTARSMI